MVVQQQPGCLRNTQQSVACSKLTCLLIFITMIFTLVANSKISDALRMLNLDVPEFVSQGDTIHLSCFYSLQNSNIATYKLHHEHLYSKLAEPSTMAPLGAARTEQVAAAFNSAPEVDNKHTNAGDASSGGLEPLYAIKWYKDGREFFRYTASGEPKKRAFASDGILVDVADSTDQTIKLVNVSLRTSGLYKCEVSTDAPHFVTKFIERKLSVFSLPNQGPVIELTRPTPTVDVRTSPIDVGLGDKIELICWSHESKPAALLDWFVNDSLNLSSILDGTEIKINEWLGINNQVSAVQDRAVSANPLDPSKEKLISAIDADYLVKQSKSELKLTVDSNLLRYLGLTRVAQTKTNRFKQNLTSRLLRRSVTNNSVDSPAFIVITSNPIQVNKLDAATDKRTEIEANSPINSRRKPNKSSKSRSQTANRNVANRVANNHIVMLEIKCTASVLQIQMSNKIKFRIIDKLAADNNEGNIQANALNGIQGARTKETRVYSSNSATGAKIQNKTPMIGGIVTMWLVFMQIGLQRR